MGHGNGRRGRSIAIGVAVALGLVLLAGCDTGLGPRSLLLVGPDRTVAVDLRCGHAEATCSGTARVRIGGLDSAPSPFSLGPGADGSVAVALTEDQYALVPATGYRAAEVVVDDATPSDSALRVAGPVGLRRSGAAFTEQVSVTADGSPVAALASGRAMSADGRFVAFASQGSFAPGDTNGRDDVYLRDRLTRTTTRISIPAGGQPDTGASTAPSLSADGRHVAFASTGALVPGDTNAGSDVYVHDRATGTTTVVSVTDGGAPADGYAGSAGISADGSHVAFVSRATNLVPGDTNGVEDVFVRDLVAGTTTRVSVASDGTQADAGPTSPTGSIPISDDGGQVAFSSPATTLVPGDTNERPDVFVHDLGTGATTRVSVTSGGAQVATYSENPSISGDGRVVAFSSAGLVPDDPGHYLLAYVHDRTTGTTTLVSRSTDGTVPTTGFARPADISTDGRRVLFTSAATTLVSGDTNVADDAFVVDRTTGATTRVSLTSAGLQTFGASSGGAISDDGRHASFYSATGGLDPGAPSNGRQIFVRDLGVLPG